MSSNVSHHRNQRIYFWNVMQYLRDTMYTTRNSENDLAKAIKFVIRRWSEPSNIKWDIEIYRSVRFSRAPSSQHRRQRFWLNPRSEKKRKLGRKREAEGESYEFCWSIRSILENARDPALFNVFLHLVRLRESIYDQTIHRNIPQFVDGRLSVIHNKKSLLHANEIKSSATAIILKRFSSFG